jgi:hypothetical protein
MVEAGLHVEIAAKGVAVVDLTDGLLKVQEDLGLLSF